MKKKIISLLLTSFVILSLFSMPVFAAEETLSGNCGDTVFWYFDSNTGAMTIVGEGEMAENYIYNEEATLEEGTEEYIFDDCFPWADFRDEIKSVTVKDGVTSIASYAFARCPNLTNVTLPDGVKYIHWSAFNGAGITDITIPDSVVYIGLTAFARSKLTEITIPASVKTIGESAFENCSNLTDVAIYGNNVLIEDWAFAYCPITDLTLHNGVARIYESTFSYCSSLTNVTLPESLIHFGDGIFRSCSELEEITFLGDAPTFAELAFYDTDVTCYYPADKSGWNDSKMQSYGGTVTWVPYFDLDTPQVSGSNVASTGKPKLTWDAVKDAVKYKVYRSTSKNGSYTLMKTTENNYYINTTADRGVTYYYYVVALSADGKKSDSSKIVTRTCDIAQPKVTASNVTSSGKPKLTWTDVDGAVEYKVYRATSKNGTYKLMKTTTSTSYTNTSAVAGKTYYYKVRAIADKSAADSAYSAVVTRTCDIAQPKIASNKVTSSGKPKLTWKAVSGAVKYKVYRSTSKNGTYKLMKTTTSTSYTNTSAVAGKTYYYKVKAIAEKSAANSAYSSVVYVKAK